MRKKKRERGVARLRSGFLGFSRIYLKPDLNFSISKSKKYRIQLGLES